MNNKHKSILKSLIPIPIVLIFDVVVFAVCTFIDTHMLPNLEGGGHPAPAMTLIAIIMLTIITAIVEISAIVSAILTVIRSRQSRNRRY